MEERSIILAALRNASYNGFVHEDDFEALALAILRDLNIEYDKDLDE